MQVSRVHSWKGLEVIHLSSWWVLFFWLVAEESDVGARYKWKLNSIGCCVINTVRSDHLVILRWCTLIDWLSNFHSPMLQIEMAQCVRPQWLPGCYNPWTPFWGCKGWCCRSARCQWARRKTAPLWQLHLSAWGQEDAAAAWITWEQRGGKETLNFNMCPVATTAIVPS